MVLVLSKGPIMENMSIPLRDLPLDGTGPAYRQIYRSIRVAILAGRAPAGGRLPSSRWLADDLAVSRNTVIAAYDQLLAEGYVVSRVGAGTYVAPQLIEERLEGQVRSKAKHRRDAGPHACANVAEPRLSRFGARVSAETHRRVYDALGSRAPVEIDFMPCVPGSRALSSEAWRRCVARELARVSDQNLSYGDPSGVLELRRQVAVYLNRSRGVECDAEDIAIVSGVAQVLSLCSRLLLEEGDAALIEDPHYIGAKHAFEVAGAEVVYASVDDEGIDLDSVPAADRDRCRLAYVTPSHQFPKGSVMSLTRRLALLEWAERVGAFVIEDDYDSEFRYSGRAIEALKSLDRSERVIYVGTFSKVLDPALRLAYVVVPKGLQDVFRKAKWMADWASPAFEQRVLAHFIEEGEFERHLRRMRTQYGAKREVLLGALSNAFSDDFEYGKPCGKPTKKPNGPNGKADQIKVFDSRAGLHLLVDLPSVPERHTHAIGSRCLQQGVAIYSAKPYYRTPPETCQLILGFTLPDEEAIGRGANILAEAVRSI